MAQSTHDNTDHKAKADHDLKTAEFLLADWASPRLGYNLFILYCFTLCGCIRT